MCGPWACWGAGGLPLALRAPAGLPFGRGGRRGGRGTRALCGKDTFCHAAFRRGGFVGSTDSSGADSGCLVEAVVHFAHAVHIARGKFRRMPPSVLRAPAARFWTPSGGRFAKIIKKICPTRAPPPTLALRPHKWRLEPGSARARALVLLPAAAPWRAPYAHARHDGPTPPPRLRRLRGRPHEERRREGVRGLGRRLDDQQPSVGAGEAVVVVPAAVRRVRRQGAGEAVVVGAGEAVVGRVRVDAPDARRARGAVGVFAGTRRRDAQDAHAYGPRGRAGAVSARSAAVRKASTRDYSYRRPSGTLARWS